MTVSKAKMESNKKHDKAHFKYQSVKLKISKYERLKKAVALSDMNTNAFLREAIAEKVNNYISKDESDKQED